MKHYPVSQNAEFKRLTLLMTNLPNKRLRDVSLRVKFLKAKEKMDITWEAFLQNSFGQQKVRLSPSQSVKSPRQTPIDREEQPKKKRAAKKKDDSEKQATPSKQHIDQSLVAQQIPQMQYQEEMQYQQPQMGRMYQSQMMQQMPMGHRPMQMVNGMMYGNTYQRHMYQQYPTQMNRQFYPQESERPMTNEDRKIVDLLNENDQCIDTLMSVIFERNGDLGDIVNTFNQNITQILQLTAEKVDTLPEFIFTKIQNPTINKINPMQQSIPQQMQPMQSGMNTPMNASLNMGANPMSQQIQPMGGNLVMAPMAGDQYRQKHPHPYPMDMSLSKGSQRDMPPDNRRGGDMM